MLLPYICEGLWSVQNDFTCIISFSVRSNIKLASTLMYTCILYDLTNILGAPCYMPARVVSSGDRVAKNAGKVLLSEF